MDPLHSPLGRDLRTLGVKIVPSRCKRRWPEGEGRARREAGNGKGGGWGERNGAGREGGKERRGREKKGGKGLRFESSCGVTDVWGVTECVRGGD